MPSHYPHFDQGQGGVYTLPPISRDTDGSVRQISATETLYCFTCVGAYIRLEGSGTECFAVHISAHLCDSYTTCTADHAKLYLNEEQASSLHGTSKAKLHRTPDLRAWVESIDPAVITDNIYVVCPLSQDPGGDLLTGYHIVQAVKDLC
ncbi:hypothetical protein DOTSEDRAFT_25300 [Dothistroma septosporum NZE10]|uniref:Uncharacterized protein n=1 Tax=Dothistroma septosporum (strain NZE10 / CBS 128990) TaxID=675120 RepID=M2WMW0_DOTSN|nr:hypothetical protein DOTSEDRAFT_25300 [Dothistroma septosporum NZE10]